MAGRVDEGVEVELAVRHVGFPLGRSAAGVGGAGLGDRFGDDLVEAQIEGVGGVDGLGQFTGGIDHVDGVLLGRDELLVEVWEGGDPGGVEDALAGSAVRPWLFTK